MSANFQRDLTPQIDQLDTIVKFLRLTSSVQSRNLMAGILEVVSERIKLVVDEFTATSALYKANLCTFFCLMHCVPHP